VGAQELRSPIEGTVLERHATIGETVGPETVLFTIGDLRRVWAVGQVYERDVGAVRSSAPARLSLEAYPGRTWDGLLSYVAGALQHESRTLPVRLEIDNLDGVLRPGLFGSLAIEASDATDALAVPAEAVQRMGDKTVVFVREQGQGDHQRFRVRTVVLGRDAGRLVELRDGVREGEDVAVSGTFTLKSELLRETLIGEE
jgi:RND family efflux transporter MFP subunit